MFTHPLNRCAMHSDFAFHGTFAFSFRGVQQRPFLLLPRSSAGMEAGATAGLSIFILLLRTGYNPYWR